MKETLEAVYENGVFRPLTTPAGVSEHGRVTLTVTPTAEAGASLADLVGTVSPEDAADMRAIIDREFERIDPREW